MIVIVKTAHNLNMKMPLKNDQKYTIKYNLTN